MAKSLVFSGDWLKLIFNNIAIANVGDASGVQPSATAGVLWFALHTADPTNAGNQTTSETTYTGYARQSVARTTGGFNVSSNSVNLVSNLEFPVCTSTSGSALTHFSIGTSQTGTGKVLYSGTLTPNVTIASSVVPRITTAQNLIVET